jgi:hypothetical protein
MDWSARSIYRWLFDPRSGASDRLTPRWLFLRALGLIYFSAFYSLLFQIRGLIGDDGILPAREYLLGIGQQASSIRFWLAPTLLWISTGTHLLVGLCWAGMLASLLLVMNFWPRGMLVVCFICFLSFVSAAQDFSGYQSDGMLLEAGFISLFLAPPGLRPGLGTRNPPIRASIFLLLWEWFRIYFESGIAKLGSGDPQWRHLTAMDEYYQNGPLPTWIGWYVQHLPHWFHTTTAAATLVMELLLVWMMFLPRRFRIVCFFIVTPWEVGVILTANYTFLNYLVLSLGVLLLDDRFFLRFVTPRWPFSRIRAIEPVPSLPLADDGGHPVTEEVGPIEILRRFRIAVSTVALGWVFYATAVPLLWMVVPVPLPTWPVAVVEPFRIANRYGLFAVMTPARYEIEFQGSRDGEHWVAYQFRHKPQATNEAPRIYAPYQPRFDWNLWFASLGEWRDNSFVVSTEERLLNNAPEVLGLFAGNPFPEDPPQQVRAMLWQYWFTSLAEKRETGQWWRRKYIGLYAPTLQKRSDGKINVIEMPPGSGLQE